jgi:plastocyanin
MPQGSETDWTVPSDLPPGTYAFYCSLPGHRQVGMEGTITIVPADAADWLSAPTPTAIPG